MTHKGKNNYNSERYIDRGDDMGNYSTKDIAKMTDIGQSTVRKYAQLLEANGYIFNRGINGYRIFSEQDINIFFEFKNTPKNERSVEDTAHDIASKYVAKPSIREGAELAYTQLPRVIESAMVPELLVKVEVLTDMSKKQSEFNEELIKRLDQQQKYIVSRLEERDEILMESLRQSQQQIAATYEGDKEQEKGFFARLFKTNKRL